MGKKTERQPELQALVEAGDRISNFLYGIGSDPNYVMNAGILQEDWDKKKSKFLAAERRADESS